MNRSPKVRFLSLTLGCQFIEFCSFKMYACKEESRMEAGVYDISDAGLGKRGKGQTRGKNL